MITLQYVRFAKKQNLKTIITKRQTTKIIINQYVKYVHMNYKKNILKIIKNIM